MTGRFCGSGRHCCVQWRLGGGLVVGQSCSFCRAEMTANQSTDGAEHGNGELHRRISNLFHGFALDTANTRPAAVVKTALAPVQLNSD